LGFTAVPNTRTVNTKALSANVTLTPDDLNDTATTHKFVASADITKLGNLSGTNTGDQTLSSLGIAGHIDEIGVSGNWNYKKYSDNTFEAFTVAAIASGTLTMTQISTSVMYASNTLTLTLPSIGITSVQHANFEQLTTSYTTSIAKNNGVGATVTYQVNKVGTSTSSVSFTGKIYGTWA